MMPQLFILRRGRHMIALAAKIVDDILVTGLDLIVPDIIDEVDARFTLGTAVHVPAAMNFFSMNLLQHDDMSVQISADNNLNRISSMQISRLRRGETDSSSNLIERQRNASVKASLGWLHITISPFCTDFASRLQQVSRTTTIHDYCAQASGLRNYQSLGATCLFPH